MLIDDAPDSVAARGQRRPGVVHQRIARPNGGRVVVGLERAVVAQPHPDRLAAAIHRHQVDIHVDQQVGLGGPAVQPDPLAVPRLPSSTMPSGASAS